MISTLLFKINHPIIISIRLIIICLILSLILLKISFSWIFFLLLLIFLRGVMVIITYMSSLAANEKIFFGGLKLKRSSIFFIFIIIFLDEVDVKKINSSFSFVRNLYDLRIFLTLLFCFLSLLLALIRLVKLIKLEEGPLVKRLLGPNLKKNIYLSNIKYCQVVLKLKKLCFENKIKN